MGDTTTPTNYSDMGSVVENVCMKDLCRIQMPGRLHSVRNEHFIEGYIKCSLHFPRRPHVVAQIT